MFMMCSLRTHRGNFSQTRSAVTHQTSNFLSSTKGTCSWKRDFWRSRSLHAGIILSDFPSPGFCDSLEPWKIFCVICRSQKITHGLPSTSGSRNIANWAMRLSPQLLDFSTSHWSKLFEAKALYKTKSSAITGRSQPVKPAWSNRGPLPSAIQQVGVEGDRGDGDPAISEEGSVETLGEDSTISGVAVTDSRSFASSKRCSSSPVGSNPPIPLLNLTHTSTSSGRVAKPPTDSSRDFDLRPQESLSVVGETTERGERLDETSLLAAQDTNGAVRSRAKGEDVYARTQDGVNSSARRSVPICTTNVPAVREDPAKVPAQEASKTKASRMVSCKPQQPDTSRVSHSNPPAQSASSAQPPTSKPPVKMSLEKTSLLSRKSSDYPELCPLSSSMFDLSAFPLIDIPTSDIFPQLEVCHEDERGPDRSAKAISENPGPSGTRDLLENSQTKDKGSAKRLRPRESELRTTVQPDAPEKSIQNALMKLWEDRTDQDTAGVAKMTTQRARGVGYSATDIVSETLKQSPCTEGAQNSGQGANVALLLKTRDTESVKQNGGGPDVVGRNRPRPASFGPGVEIPKTNKQDAGAAKATEDGVEITRATEDGAKITKATKVGAKITEATEVSVKITKAAKDGVNITKATKVGVKITNATKDGVKITKETEDGLKITKETEDGVKISKATKDGVKLTKTTEDSVKITKATKDGVKIANATKDGVKIAKATEDSMKITKATKDGAKIANATKDGEKMSTAMLGGVETNKATENGVKVTKATENGVRATKATKDGENITKATEDGDKTVTTTKDGAKLTKATEDGVKIKATEDGVKIAKATEDSVKIAKATEDGENITKATEDGEKITTATKDGAKLTKATEDGVKIAKATEDSVKIAKTEDGVKIAKATEDRVKIAKATEDGGKITKATEDGENITKATEDGEQIVTATKDVAEIAKATTDGAKLTKATGDSVKITKATEDGVEIAKAMEESAKVMQATEVVKIPISTREGAKIAKPTEDGEMIVKATKGSAKVTQAAQLVKIPISTTDGVKIAKATEDGEKIVKAKKESAKVTQATELVKIPISTREGAQIAKVTEDGEKITKATKDSVKITKATEAGKKISKATKDSAEITRATKDGGKVTQAAEGVKIAISTRDGVKIAKAIEDGARKIVKATKGGTTIAKATEDGGMIVKQTKEGAKITKPTKDGIKMTEAAEVLKSATANKDGANITNATKDGVKIIKAAGDGVEISKATKDGVKMTKATEDGAEITKAAKDGVSPVDEPTQVSLLSEDKANFSESLTDCVSLNDPSTVEVRPPDTVVTRPSCGVHDTLSCASDPKAGAPRKAISSRIQERPGSSGASSARVRDSVTSVCPVPSDDAPRPPISSEQSADSDGGAGGNFTTRGYELEVESVEEGEYLSDDSKQPVDQSSDAPDKTTKQKKCEKHRKNNSESRISPRKRKDSGTSSVSPRKRKKIVQVSRGKSSRELRMSPEARRKEILSSLFDKVPKDKYPRKRKEIVQVSRSRSISEPRVSTAKRREEIWSSSEKDTARGENLRKRKDIVRVSRRKKSSESRLSSEERREKILSSIFDKSPSCKTSIRREREYVLRESTNNRGGAVAESEWDYEWRSEDYRKPKYSEKYHKDDDDCYVKRKDRTRDYNASGVEDHPASRRRRCERGDEHHYRDDRKRKRACVSDDLRPVAKKRSVERELPRAHGRRYRVDNGRQATDPRVFALDREGEFLPPTHEDSFRTHRTREVSFLPRNSGSDWLSPEALRWSEAPPPLMRWRAPPSFRLEPAEPVSIPSFAPRNRPARMPRPVTAVTWAVPEYSVQSAAAQYFESRWSRALVTAGNDFLHMSH